MKTAWVLMVGICLSGGALGKAQGVVQSSPQGPPPVGGMPPMGGGLGTEPISPRLSEQQAKARNTERQKKLVDDTNKLLALATELKTDVDKTNANILSLDVIKKADEIEKLAHSVKERMKD